MFESCRDRHSKLPKAVHIRQSLSRCDSKRVASSVQRGNSRTEPSVPGVLIDALMPELSDFDSRQRERRAKYRELKIVREMVCQPRRQAAHCVSTASGGGACEKNGALH